MVRSLTVTIPPNAKAERTELVSDDRCIVAIVTLNPTQVTIIYDDSAPKVKP